MELDLAPISGRSLGCRSVAMGSNKDSGGIIQVSIMGGENMNSVQELDVMLATPSEALIEFIGRRKGDILILGVGGKMGPSLARRAKNAVMAAGVKKEIIGVSRFSEEASRQQLEDSGIHTIVADLMDEVQLQALPDCAYSPTGPTSSVSRLPRLCTGESGYTFPLEKATIRAWRYFSATRPAR